MLMRAEETIVDAKGPAEGTSFGNAGILANSSIVPVTTPGLIKKVPGMLFSPSGPLSTSSRTPPLLVKLATT